MRLAFAITLPLALVVLRYGEAGLDGAAAEIVPGGEDKKQSVPFIRVAELEIDPAQLDGYKAAVKEEMEASVRVEPGVLAIYCVAERDNPAKLRFFEMYADEAAYRAHVASPHFRKYVEATKPMIRSRTLIDAVPVQLSAKKILSLSSTIASENAAAGESRNDGSKRLN